MAEPASRYLPSGNYHIFAPRPLRPDVELKCPVFVEPDTPPGQNRPLYVAQVHGIQPTEVRITFSPTFSIESLTQVSPTLVPFRMD